MTKTALIVIDVQNYFANEHTKDIPDKISRFIDKNEFDHLLFTKFVNSENSNYFRLLGWKECLDSPDTDIHPALERFANDKNTFSKTSYSIFKAEGLVHFLDNNGIRKLLLCGIDTDACVLASAFEAFDMGYNVKVLENLSASHSGEGLNSAALMIINKNLTPKQG